MKLALLVGAALLSSGCNINLGPSPGSDRTSPQVVSAGQFRTGESLVWAHYRSPSPDPIRLERLLVLSVSGSTVYFSAHTQDNGVAAWSQTAQFSADLEACVSARTNGEGNFQLGWWNRNPDGTWGYSGVNSDTTLFDEHFNCAANPAHGWSLEQKNLSTPLGAFGVARFANPGDTTGDQNWFVSTPGSYQGISAERIIPFLGNPEIVRFESAN